LTTSPLTDALPDRGAAQTLLGIGEIDNILTIPQGFLRAPTGFTCSCEIDLRRPLGGIGKDDHLVIDDLDEPSEHHERLFTWAFLYPELTLREKRDQRGVTRQDSERAFESGSYNHVYIGLLIDDALTGDDFD